MIDYSALKTKWATLPAGDTTAQKLAVINALSPITQADLDAAGGLA